MSGRLAAAALLALAPLAAAGRPAVADGPVLPNRVAVLRGLDKITARTVTLSVPVDETASFGTLRVTPKACLETPPTEPPESAAFLKIGVADPGQAEQTAFSGWMFASTPSVSALEHPVYDVWLLDCAEPVPVPELAPPARPTTEGQNG